MYKKFETQDVKADIEVTIKLKDRKIQSEYGVICFYFNPGEEYIYYIYLTDEEDYINLDKDLFSALNLRDSLTKESVMINHVLHRIHDKKVW